ncbi:hypothetical protein [Longimycelium tulufanense]|nr:hypothetical protein [Longimycelium tulufanense]
MVWSILSGLAAVGTIMLVLWGYPVVAVIPALVGVFLSLFGSQRVKARRQEEFRVRFRSVEQIRATHDLSGFHRLRDQAGEVAAVRAVRKEFPGISLVDAVALVRS